MRGMISCQGSCRQTMDSHPAPDGWLKGAGQEEQAGSPETGRWKETDRWREMRQKTGEESGTLTQVGS